MNRENYAIINPMYDFDNVDGPSPCSLWNRLGDTASAKDLQV